MLAGKRAKQKPYNIGFCLALFFKNVLCFKKGGVL